MKRPPDRERDGPTQNSSLEARLAEFLRRHPRFFLYLGAGLTILFVVVMVAVKAGS